MTATVASAPAIETIAVADLRHALAEGWRDFRRAPLFGLFFSSFYVVCGLALGLAGAGAIAWILAFSLGFPLVAPFAAVGLYEVSRRLEAGDRLEWPAVLGVVWSERGGQTPWIGAVLIVLFLSWSFFAHYSLAIYLGQTTLTNVTTSWDVFLTAGGLAMIAIEVVAGGAAALLVFAITVVALPLLVDREIDFVTAMILSVRAFAANRRVMLIWAATIAVLLFAAMVPLLLGLLVVLPLLGHASWHLYRRVIRHPG